MGHTPGPWKAERHDGAGNIIIDTDTPVDRGRLGIASVRRASNADHEVEANARLIAAAPDLLAACEAAIVEFKAQGQALGEYTPPEMVDTWNKVDAAIIKATKGTYDDRN